MEERLVQLEARVEKLEGELVKFAHVAFDAKQRIVEFLSLFAMLWFKGDALTVLQGKTQVQMTLEMLLSDEYVNSMAGLTRLQADQVRERLRWVLENPTLDASDKPN